MLRLHLTGCFLFSKTTDINDCLSSPCKNGGTCLDRIASFTCACPQGFTGATCDQVLDPCAGSPCGPGECVPVESKYFFCRCPTGLKGPHCNLTTASHCDAAPCQNGGTCQDLDSTFVCRCAPDYVGNRCQQKRRSPCEGEPCLNGATCINVDDDKYQCWCPDGFSGPACEHSESKSVPNGYTVLVAFLSIS